MACSAGPSTHRALPREGLALLALEAGLPGLAGPVARATQVRAVVHVPWGEHINLGPTYGRHRQSWTLEDELKSGDIFNFGDLRVQI